MFCVKCGNKIAENDCFCTKCGAPVKMPDAKEKDLQGEQLGDRENQMQKREVEQEEISTQKREPEQEGISTQKREPEQGEISTQKREPEQGKISIQKREPEQREISMQKKEPEYGNRAKQGEKTEYGRIILDSPKPFSDGGRNFYWLCIAGIVLGAVVSILAGSPIQNGFAWGLFVGLALWIIGRMFQCDYLKKRYQKMEYDLPFSVDAEEFANVAKRSLVGEDVAVEVKDERTVKIKYRGIVFYFCLSGDCFFVRWNVSFWKRFLVGISWQRFYLGRAISCISYLVYQIQQELFRGGGDIVHYKNVPGTYVKMRKSTANLAFWVLFLGIIVGLFVRQKWIGGEAADTEKGTVLAKPEAKPKVVVGSGKEDLPSLLARDEDGTKEGDDAKEEDTSRGQETGDVVSEGEDGNDNYGEGHEDDDWYGEYDEDDSWYGESDEDDDWYDKYDEDDGWYDKYDEDDDWYGDYNEDDGWYGDEDDDWYSDYGEDNDWYGDYGEDDDRYGEYDVSMEGFGGEIVYGTYVYYEESCLCTAVVGFYSDLEDFDYIRLEAMGYGGHQLIDFEGILERRSDGSYGAYSDFFDTEICCIFSEGGLDTVVEYSESTYMETLQGRYELEGAFEAS